MSDSPFLAIARQFSHLLNKCKSKVTFAASSFGDLFYIIRKQKGRDLALEFLREIVTFCQVATVDSTTINMALTTNFKDFEDAIQYSTAVLNHLDAIITRNQVDFPVTTPRIINPEQLIQELTNP